MHADYNYSVYDITNPCVPVYVIIASYTVQQVIFGGKIFVVFVVEHWTTNILTTNEATLPTFTCSASSNHELTKYC